ncbi:MAG: hypothetical protein RSE91_00310 [Bacilli bacterium]
MSRIFNKPISKDEIVKLNLVYDFCKNIFIERSEKFDETDIQKLKDLKFLVSLCENYMRSAKKFLAYTYDIDTKELSNVHKTNLIITLSSMMINTDTDLENLQLDNLELLVEFISTYNTTKYQQLINIYDDELLTEIGTKVPNDDQKLRVLKYCNDKLAETEDLEKNDYHNKLLTKKLTNLIKEYNEIKHENENETKRK